MNKIVLFDMDGTITPPREPIKEEMVTQLKRLDKHCDIGIVTGSDFAYLYQQCKNLLEAIYPAYWNLFPCNGTKKYDISPGSTYNNKKWEAVYEVDMRKVIGSGVYNELICQLTVFQLEIIKEFTDSISENTIDLSGTFFQYRGSMLNWCPIGRSANMEERKKWIQADKKFKLRENIKENILYDPRFSYIDVALGGETSFDIYPRGWDKTYVMRHLTDYDDIYFVGDACHPGGNDRTLYNLLGERAFHTSGPEETFEIIEKLIES